ncbi:hypothetical protein OY671_008557, partial [Metschnikowia pulcherrima]
SALAVGWRGALMAGGIGGFASSSAWIWLARGVASSRQRGGEDVQRTDNDTATDSYGPILASRATWAIVIAKASSDMTWWFVNFWLADYYRKAFGSTLADLEFQSASAIAFAGSGLGASSAAKAAPAIDDLSQLTSIAPPLNGKAWSREAQAFSAMIAPPLGETEARSSANNEIALAGYRMTGETAASIKALAWPSFDTSPASVLISSREQTQEAEAVAERTGGKADVLPFTGYGAMMYDVTASEPPLATLASLAERLARGNSSRDQA